MSLRSILNAIPVSRSHRLNTLLGEFIQRSSESRTPGEAYAALDHALSKLLDYDRITIRFADTENGTVTVAYINGKDDVSRACEHHRPLAGTGTEFVMNTGEPVVIANTGDPEQQERYPFLRPNPKSNLPSILIAPVSHRARPVGSIVLRSARRGAYSKADTRLLQLVTTYVTPVLVNTLQLQQLEREVHERTELAELGRAVSSTIDFADVWDVFISKVKNMISCDRLVVALIDEGEVTITDRFIHGVRIPEWDDKPTRELKIMPADGIIKLKQAKIVGTEENDAIHMKTLGYRMSERLGLRSAMYAPLISGDRAIGTLSVRSKTPDSYTEQDLALFERIAIQIGGPLAAAEMHARSLRMAAERAVHRDLEARNRQLLEMSATKSRFISTISHELRTPLTSILAFSDIIRRSKSSILSERDQKHLDVISRNGNHLKVLIDDLLDISEIEADVMRINGSVFTLQELVEGLSVSVRPALRAKSQLLVIEMPEEPVRLVTDRERIEQILINLLANANKYSSAGTTVTVRGSVEHGSVRISVADQGPGIDERDFYMVFEAFNRLDNEVTRANHGPGLGLAVSRKLARALGGDIEIESEKSRGSVFTLVLPVQLEQAA